MESPDYNINTLPSDNLPDLGGGRKKRIIILVALVIIFLIIIGLLLYFFIFKFKDNKVESDQDNLIIQKQTENSFDKAIDNTYKVDKDFDGISDEDEKKYGTSSTSIDTDGDGLTDSSEINIYKTDPLKKDTDGDGYEDGIEVRNGYSPLE